MRARTPLRRPVPLRPWLAGLMLCTVGACSPEPAPQRATLYVFGTEVEVLLRGAEPGVADTALARLQAAYQAMHRDWHAWEDGELTRLNQAISARQPHPVRADLAALVRESQRLERLSEGRFNPAIGRLVALWGFHTSDWPVTGPPPAAADVEKVAALQPSTLDIEIADGLLTSHNPAVQLDFGAIAKGLAVDRGCALLAEAGVESALISAGGDLRACGAAGNRAWRVGIRKPGSGWPGEVIGGVEVQGDEAVFTSGVDQRYREDAGERWPHIIDPRTGWPVQNVSGVTVIAPDGVLADAAATALVVAGPVDWPRVARRMGVDAVLVVDANGQLQATPAMRERLLLEKEFEDRIQTVALPPG